MSQKVNIDHLADVIMEELDDYHQTISSDMKKIISKNSDEFVENTRRDAPRGRRKKYYKYIAKKNKIDKPYIYTDVWYVKDPEYRLTHLIKNGHALKRGGRTLGETKGKDFITSNFEKMEKNLEQDMKDVI